jgi:hypothetical protein
MTTKSKARKAPAVKARAPKLAKPAASEPSRDVNKIEVMASRYRWLEADQDYQTAIAPRERDADRRHEAEQQRIIAELRTLVPKDYFELAALFRFAIDELKTGSRSDGAEFDMLSNVYEAFPCVLTDERETMLQQGMKNMIEFFDKRAGLSSRLALCPEIMEQIGRGIT